ncbi:hypothetical protein JTB14_033310 [Gonioctena quinquepunctata]|nr:hypothetical protein JTB14_033310 [Gonioctena quinquepunctata]
MNEKQLKGSKMVLVEDLTKLRFGKEFKNAVQSYDIVAITETWLTNDLRDDTVSMGDYNLFRSVRTTSRGGGVVFYVNKNISCFIYENIDQIWIQINVNNCKIAKGNIYRPPSGNQVINDVDESLSQIIPTVDEIICLGDMNVDLLKPDNVLSECFHAYDFEQIINEPTRPIVALSRVLGLLRSSLFFLFHAASGDRLLLGCLVGAKWTFFCGNFGGVSVQCGLLINVRLKEVR